MNTKSFLRDWQPGDFVTAADLQALADSVAMLEAAAPGGGGAMRGGGVLRVSDGPVEMPWQVYTEVTQEGIRLRVIPGEVIVGVRDADTSEVRTATLADGANVVEDFTPGEACTVWLELTGTVSVTRVTTQGMAGDTYNARFQRARLENPALRVTCAPADDALRVWALAAYTPTHEQRVTQLTWGDLSVLECRGMIDEAGGVVWPQDRSAAASWTEEAHRTGMATMCGVDASHSAESITGTLSGCIDMDGAVEFFMGPSQEEEIDPDPVNPWPDDPPVVEPPDPDEPDPDDPYEPVHPDPPGPDDPEPEDVDPIYVEFGYVAGEGFESCRLVNNAAGTNVSWKLVLDTAYLADVLSDIKAEGQVAFSAGGSSPGVWATVSMGLGDCLAAASGTSASGSAGLRFQGQVGDASTKVASIRITYTASPRWSPAQTTWLLPADTLHEAGNYVIREPGNYAGNPFVEANHWYRFKINKSLLRIHAQDYFRSQLASISVSDSDSDTSSDSTVTATLSGTILNPIFSLTLS